ncbi:MAG TPA: multicopper oxidase domain-containing protein [Terriglobales bacterium]|jgi:FtsP/CotA-like multicopper oxidase with cupredoxin domain|nr:multicopper oxidase domain-containing protein [Terriglobales bacterium]
MERRRFLKHAGLAIAGIASHNLVAATKDYPPQTKADFTLHIGSVSFDIAPGKTIHTFGYNGQVPGPILRMKEGTPVTVDIFNDTDHEEIVHWHGQMISVEADGATEEGTPAVPAHQHRRYSFTPKPAGARWYHSHAFAGKDLHRGLYSGQFGFVYIEPKNDSGQYDREVFLAMHQWEPYYSASMEESDEGSAPPPPNNGLEVGYRAFSFNDKALGHGEPIRVKRGDRILFHFLNASATETVNVGLPSHQFQVLALDGNPVPNPQTVKILQVGAAERVDAIVSMDAPGVWILGSTDDDDRQHGFGVAVEYADRKGAPQWTKPEKQTWDYTVFGKDAKSIAAPDGQFDLVFKKIPGGHGGFNRWTINGKSYPHTDPMMVHPGKRYRMIFRNESDDAHPLHLHRHSFELTKVYGKPTSGILKDTVVVNANKTIEVDFTADNPGNTLFHCHQQLHMDFGFMALLEYA